MRENIFTGATLREALKSGDLTRANLVIVGMVKESAQNGSVSFAPSGCDSWTDLPTALIEEAEHLGQQTCKDHTHPLFRISLNEPKDPTAKIFAALLGAAGSHPVIAGGGMTHATRPSMQRAPGMNGPLQDGQPMATQSMRRTGGFGGFGGHGGFGGGLNAWGCWESECCDCTMEECWPTGDGRQVCVCKQSTCKPCTRCIWPY